MRNRFKIGRGKKALVKSHKIKLAVEESNGGGGVSMKAGSKINKQRNCLQLKL